MFKEWKEKTIFGKSLTVIGLIISASVLILAFLQIIGIWENAICVFEPLLGVLMLIQTIENWKKNKSVAYLSLFTAVFIFIVALFIFLK